MRIIVMSRQQIERTTSFETNTGVISIRTPGDPGPQNIKRGAVRFVSDCIPIECNDIESRHALLDAGIPPAEVEKLKPFTLEHAEEIYKKVKWWIENKLIDQIVVHCDAGISRSAGIAAALNLWLNNTSGEFVPGPRFNPNKTIMTVMIRAIMGPSWTEKGQPVPEHGKLPMKEPFERQVTREEYVEKILSAYRTASPHGPRHLDGLYDGKSAKTQELIREAYERGVRRGVGLAWEAKQKIFLT